MKQVLLFFFLLTFSAFAQVNKPGFISGKVVSSVAISDVNIINKTTEKTSKTTTDGQFEIEAKIGDELVFSSVELVPVQRLVRPSDLVKKLLIPMQVAVVNLDEVQIKESSINAVSLGIVSKDQKTYTPAEAKLYTAQTGLLDPLLNRLSGRTAMLKKEIIVERNEKLLLRMEYMFDNDYFTKRLKIPADYIKGFEYYAIENVDFARALNEKNKTLAKFRITPLANAYLELLKNDNQEQK